MILAKPVCLLFCLLPACFGFVRMYETAGKDTTAKLDLRFVKTQWTGTFRLYEIKTLRINPKWSAISEANILEQ